MVRDCPWFWAAAALSALVAGCSSDRGSQAGPDTAIAGASGTAAPAAASGNGGALAGRTGAAGMASTAPVRPSQAGWAGSTNAGAGTAAISGAGGSGAAGLGATNAAGASGSAGAAGGGAAGTSGMGGSAAGRSGAGGATAGRGTGGAGGSGAATSPTPVYRVPLRVHVGMSKLTDAELQPILSELNSIWLKQAGICFEIEVTTSETNRTGGFDFRYTSGTIPGASTANGVTQGPHSIWSIDHPRLNDVSMPVMNPTSRTTAHELGHALDLAHQNPPPSNDCSSPCYCAQLGDDCDEYLMRSGTKGFRISKPEVEIARKAAERVALADRAPAACAAPVFMR